LTFKGEEIYECFGEHLHQQIKAKLNQLKVLYEKQYRNEKIFNQHIQMLRNSKDSEDDFI